LRKMITFFSFPKKISFDDFLNFFLGRIENWENGKFISVLKLNEIDVYNDKILSIVIQMVYINMSIKIWKEKRDGRNEIIADSMESPGASEWFNRNDGKIHSSMLCS
jgi:hypothetical protein